MVFLWKCACLNVGAHLVAAPKEWNTASASAAAAATETAPSPSPLPSSQPPATATIMNRSRSKASAKERTAVVSSSQALLEQQREGAECGLDGLSQKLRLLLSSPAWSGSPCLLGALALAGVQTVMKWLVKEVKVADDESWTLYRCLNCDIPVLATTATLPTVVILNGNIAQKSVEERLKENPNYVFSRVYRIILKQTAEVANKLLECPDASSPEPLEAFTDINSQLETALKEENRRMEERIELYKREQQAAYQQFASSTYVERKLVWYSLCSALQWPLSSTSVTPKPVDPPLKEISSEESMQQTYFNRNVLIIEDYEASKGSKGPLVVTTDSHPPTEHPIQTYPVGPVENAEEQTERPTGGTAIFEFEEEQQEKDRQDELQQQQQQQQQEHGEQSSEGQQDQQSAPMTNEAEAEMAAAAAASDSELEEAENDAVDNRENISSADFEMQEKPARVMESITLLGTSLPVSIPSPRLVAERFAPQGRLPQTKQKLHQQQQQQQRQHQQQWQRKTATATATVTATGGESTASLTTPRQLEEKDESTTTTTAAAATAAGATATVDAAYDGGSDEETVVPLKRMDDELLSKSFDVPPSMNRSTVGSLYGNI